MLLTYFELLVMLALLMGGIAALLNYLGGSTLYLVIRLTFQGIIPFQARFISSYRSLSALPYAARCCSTLIYKALYSWHIEMCLDFVPRRINKDQRVVMVAMPASEKV
jgi:hypothetical protein